MLFGGNWPLHCRDSAGPWASTSWADSRWVRGHAEGGGGGVGGWMGGIESDWKKVFILSGGGLTNGCLEEGALSIVNLVSTWYISTPPPQHTHLQTRTVYYMSTQYVLYRAWYVLLFLGMLTVDIWNHPSQPPKKKIKNWYMYMNDNICSQRFIFSNEKKNKWIWLGNWNVSLFLLLYLFNSFIFLGQNIRVYECNTMSSPLHPIQV